VIAQLVSLYLALIVRAASPGLSAIQLIAKMMYVGLSSGMTAGGRRHLPATT
jgi:hypothetical protein